MERQEAAEIIRERIDLAKKEYADQVPEYIQALEKAVEALGKIDEMEELQTPEPPVLIPAEDMEVPSWECPNCGEELSVLDIIAGRCKWCGKVLKDEVSK